MSNLTPRGRRNYMKDFMKNFFEEDLFAVPEFFTEKLNSLSMRTDIRETDKEYIIEAEIPGFNKDEIKVEVNNGYLTIKADRQEIINEEKEGYIRKERRHGAYQRSFKLDNVKENEITAKYENGVLKLKLPKIDEGKRSSRRIDIH